MSVVLPPDLYRALNDLATTLCDVYVKTETPKRLPQWLSDGSPVETLDHVSIVLGISRKEAAWHVLCTSEVSPELKAQAEHEIGVKTCAASESRYDTTKAERVKLRSRGF